LDDAFFARAQWRMPAKKTAVTLSVDDDVLKWFEAQGVEFQVRINAGVANLRRSASGINFRCANPGTISRFWLNRR